MPTDTPSAPPPTDVWAEFGLPNCDDLLEKARLVTRIEQTLCLHNLDPAAGARLLDTPEDTFSALLQNQLDVYPTDTLQRFLERLTGDTPVPPEQSRADVS